THVELELTHTHAARPDARAGCTGYRAAVSVDRQHGAHAVPVSGAGVAPASPVRAASSGGRARRRWRQIPQPVIVSARDERGGGTAGAVPEHIPTRAALRR